MKNIEELEQLKKRLEFKASLPDADFELKLKKDLLKLNSKESIFDKFSNIFTGNSFNYSLAFNLMIMVLILSIGIFTTFKLGLNNSAPQVAQNKIFSQDSTKQEILNNVIKNNPLILIQNTTQAANLDTQSNANLPASTTMESITDNNLMYRIVMTSELGLQSTTCLQTAKQPKKIDLVNYISNDGLNSYFKSVATDNDNNVLSYYLSDNNSQIYFNGGLNASKFSSATNQTSQLDTMVKETLVIDSIISMETKTGSDNVEYIQIEQKESNNMCNLNDNIGPIISNIKVDLTTFKILSKSYYIGTVSKENLIITYNFETHTYEPDNQMIESEFKYNLGYPIVENDLVNQ
jgi:hypothetical protein